MKTPTQKLIEAASRNVKLKRNEHFTVLALMRNGVIVNDGSFVGSIFRVVQTSNGVVECVEYNRYLDNYKPFNYTTFIHGINCVLRRIKKPITDKQRQELYNTVKLNGCDWWKVPSIKL